MSVRQRGMGLVITVMLILVVAIVAVLVATSFSSSSVRDTGALADSTEALYLAETGIERAIKRFATGTPCDATLQDASPTELIAGSGKTFQVTKASPNDFSGVALVPSQTQCRIEAEGRFGSSNVSRKLQAIIDKNLLGGANNEDYNNPAAVGTPSGWALNPVTGFADDGGPDGTAPACSRSAWLLKTATAGTGAATTTGLGQTAVNFTVTGGSTTRIWFDYRVINPTSDAGCAAGTGSGPAVPGCAASGGNQASMCFRLVATAGPVNSDVTLNTNSTITQARACPDPGTPSTFTPCQLGFPVKGSVSMTISGGGTRTMTTFFYYLRLQQAGRREIFLDNIEAVNNTAIGAARVQYWRDCTVASCP